MIKSMTGYGEARGQSGEIKISVELKSVNNRHFDCTVKLPRVYMAAEESARALVQRHISRGKVDVFVAIDASGADFSEIRVNWPVARAYVAALRALAAEFLIPGELDALSLARLPDVFQAERREAGTEELYSGILAVLEEALGWFDDMRAREGGRMRDDVAARLVAIERLTARATERGPATVAEYRARLEGRLREVLEDKNIAIDEGRILTEAAIFADRVAVNEELVRLGSHVREVRAALESQEPVGRRLDFLVQELNREANTLGSKGNDAELARIVVDMKAEIEKIREQAQNIE